MINYSIGYSRFLDGGPIPGLATNATCNEDKDNVDYNDCIISFY